MPAEITGKEERKSVFIQCALIKWKLYLPLFPITKVEYTQHMGTIHVFWNVGRDHWVAKHENSIHVQYQTFWSSSHEFDTVVIGIVPTNNGILVLP